MLGTVKKKSPRGFCFLECDDGSHELFLHANELPRDHFALISVGDRLVFDIGPDASGRRQAVDARIADDETTRRTSRTAMAETDQTTAAQAAADEAERYAAGLEAEASNAEARRDKIISATPELSATSRAHAAGLPSASNGSPHRSRRPARRRRRQPGTGDSPCRPKLKSPSSDRAPPSSTAPRAQRSTRSTASGDLSRRQPRVARCRARASAAVATVAS